MNDFTFHIVEAKHESIILEWLEKSHVREWFFGEGLQSTISGLKEFINNESSGVNLWIAYIGNEPLAYLITSKLSQNKKDEAEYYRAWMQEDKNMMTLDILIGNEKYLGQGLCAPLILDFIKQQCEDIDIIFIDPDAKNIKAIHVYEKVGFKKVGEFVAAWNPVPHDLMMLEK